jgi:hypothetical protein
MSLSFPNRVPRERFAADRDGREKVGAGLAHCIAYLDLPPLAFGRDRDLLPAWRRRMVRLDKAAALREESSEEKGGRSSCDS